MDVMFSDMMILFSCIYTKFQFASFSLFKEKKRKKASHILYAAELWDTLFPYLVCMVQIRGRSCSVHASLTAKKHSCLSKFRLLISCSLTPPTYPPHPPSNPIFFSVVCDEQCIRIVRVVELIEFSPVWRLRLTAQAIYFKIISGNRQSSSRTCSWAVSGIAYSLITFYFILMWPSLMTGRECP